jgi:hypothetical protein
VPVAPNGSPTRDVQIEPRLAGDVRRVQRHRHPSCHRVTVIMMIIIMIMIIIMMTVIMMMMGKKKIKWPG